MQLTDLAVCATPGSLRTARQQPGRAGHQDERAARQAARLPGQTTFSEPAVTQL